MKKVLLMSVFVFALSKGSFAANSMADMLKEEKASFSFIPKIEVQTVSNEFIKEEKTEWSGDNLSENIAGPVSSLYDEDLTHSWRLEYKNCYNTSTEHFKNVVSDKIYQNASGGKCKKTREIIYELVEVKYKYWTEEYSAAQCYSNPPEESFKYTCEESTKTVDYEDGEKVVRTYKETDTCYGD